MFAEIGTVDVDFFGEGDGMGAHGWDFGGERDGEFFVVVVWKVVDDDGDGIEDEHESGNGLLEILPYRLFEANELDVG